ncbi:unnamed protein product [Adineta ricciae]|nr:unnamed protein product [Adineta ricciae]
MQALEGQEIRRIDKEKHQEWQILIRDLFSIPRDRLFEELQRNNLSEDQINIFSTLTVGIPHISSNHPTLYMILQKVSREFEIDPVQMLNYLKEKKFTNRIFHLNIDLRKYAVEHSVYDLKEFLEQLNMHPLDEDEQVLLQPLFRIICQIMKQNDL